MLGAYLCLSFSTCGTVRDPCIQTNLLDSNDKDHSRVYFCFILKLTYQSKKKKKKSVRINDKGSTLIMDKKNQYLIVEEDWETMETFRKIAYVRE